MKHLFKTIALFCLCAITLASCGDEPTPEKKEDLKLELSKTELGFSQNTDTKVVCVTTNGVWYVENNSDWITISPMGGKGNGAVTVTVSKNTSGQARESYFSVAIDSDSKIVVVSQSATDTPEESGEETGGDENGEDSGNENDQYSSDGSQYVDLGLSVKWATCNLGASKSEEYGDYYAWGETSTKSTYNWSIYKYCKGSSSSTLTKYNTKSSYGTVDNKTTLEKSDDVAYTTLGGKWRMPTYAEWTELRENCTWTWTTVNGVNGYKVEATNGNSIFLPAAGYRYDSSLGDDGSLGNYWSSSLYESSPCSAWSVGFYSDDVRRGSDYRDCGRSVRPVLGSE